MMDYGDTASIISSAFTDFDDTGEYDEGGLDQQEPREMKHVLPLKTEVEDLASLAGALGEEDDDDHFLENFNASTFVYTDAFATKEDGEDDEAQFEKPKRVRKKPDPYVTSSSQKPKPKSKQKPQERAKRGGKPEETAMQERNVSSQRQKRALLSAEEKEKLREKWKLDKQRARQLEKERRLEEKKPKPADLEASVNSDKEDETLPSRRPSRPAKLKPAIKDEPESAPESDYEDFKPKKSKRTSTPRKSAGSGGGGRVKVNSVTSDEKAKLREKWREEARARRAPKRGPVKTEVEEDPDFDDETEKKRKGRQRRGSNTTTRRHNSSDGSGTSRHSGTTAARRKKMENMTEEEREAFKAKWREEARIKRARQRQSMTPEQREEHLRVQREKRREQRAMAKAAMTEQEREEENRKARERKREKRALMTPEQQREEVQRDRLRRIEKFATMSESEQNEHKMREYMGYVARKGALTAEEMQERKRRALENARRYRGKMTAEDLERRRVRLKQYRDSMTPEKRARYLEKVKECNRRRVERLQKDPEKWETERKRRYNSNLKWRQHLVDQGIKILRKKNQNKTDTPSKRRYARKSVPPNNETPEQRAERIRKSRKLTQKRILLKKKLEKQKLLESGHSVDEIQQATYKNSEQRVQALMRARINHAKRILRGRLEGKLPPEEILQRLTEVEKTYQPTFEFRPYKPRPQAWKPIDPSDLALLEEEQGKKRRDISCGAETTPKMEPRQPQASSSKTPTTSRRARAPKNVQLQQQQQQSQQNDRLSVVTPEPINYTRTHQQPPFQPQQCHHHTANQYTPPQYSAQQTVAYTAHHLQQPQTQATQSYSLQHILDGIAYQESGSHGPPILNQTAYQQQHDNNSSSHQEYASSFDTHSPPPASPPGDYDDHEYFGDTIADASSFSRQPPQDPSASSANPTAVRRKRDPIPKDKQSRPKKSTGPKGHKPGPRGPQNRGKPDVIHDNVCDECGNAYKQSYMARHKAIQHNPSYRDQTCQICFEKFTVGSQWYKHYMEAHNMGSSGPQTRNKSGVVHDAVCDECGNSYYQSYLAEHKAIYHNPNYRDQTCQICFEKFTVGGQWYKHYMKTHHTGSRAPDKVKPHMCDICGLRLSTKQVLEKHKYYIHGDGRKKENFLKCPVCPGEVLLKEKTAMYTHMKRNHPDYNRGGHDCYRCDQTFPSEDSLSLHAKQEHSESYFPCQYCKACRFTAIGLTFHLFRCKKVSQQIKDEMRKVPGTIILDRELLPCEICKRKVAMTGLTRHYWEMHNVKEDEFTCPECNKSFRVREFWAVHMEEKHQKTVEQVKDLVKCLNVSSREGLEIKNPDGVKGGVPGNTPSKAASQRRIELGFVQRRRNGGGRKGQKVKSKAGERRKKDDDSTKIGARQFIVVAEEEEEEELGLEQASANESVKEAGKKRGRKPRTKAASKGKKYEESENEDEDEEDNDNWRESGSDDDHEYQPTIRADSVTERRTSSRSRGKSNHTFRESDSSTEENDEQETSEESEDDEDQILKAVMKQEIE